MYINRNDTCFWEIEDVVVSKHGKQYEVLERLGVGGNAIVYSCLDGEGNELAVKFLINTSKKSKKRFLQEISVLKNIQHPNLIKYYDEGEISARMRKDRLKAANVTIPFIIMEKADSDLRAYLKNRGKLKYSEYASQFFGLSEALETLHNKVIHRDIKLENILIIGERWVISDLGLCSYISEDEHEDITALYEKVGPKYWMSPEAINRIYNGRDEIIQASDVFQLVAIFWFAVTARYPLGNVSIEEWGNGDQEMCRVLLKGLSHDVKKRQKDGAELHSDIKKVIIKHSQP